MEATKKKDTENLTFKPKINHSNYKIKSFKERVEDNLKNY